MTVWQKPPNQTLTLKLTFLPKCTVGENRSGRQVLANVPRTEASTGQKHSLTSERVKIKRHSLTNAKRPKGTAALTLSVDAADEKNSAGFNSQKADTTDSNTNNRVVRTGSTVSLS